MRASDESSIAILPGEEPDQYEFIMRKFVKNTS